MFKVDRFCWAEDLTSLALTSLKVRAGNRVNYRDVWNRLREGAINRFSISHPHLKDVIDHFLGALFDADPTSSAQFFIDVLGLFLDPNVEVPNKPGNLLYLAIAQQGDIRVGANVRHSRGENAGGAVESREGLVELSHVSTDGRLTLHEIDRISSISQFE